MSYNTSWLHHHRFNIIAITVLLLVAGVPRLFNLGTFLTADEKNWMGRSYEFIRAFKDFRFNDMLQTSHPGVTTMWTVGTAVTVKMLVSHIPFTFRNLVHFAAAAQLPIALLTTISVPAIYLLLRKLFTPSLALLAALLIALDPLLIGYSRVAHVDALLTYLIFMAGLAMLIWRATGYRRPWLIGAAILSGFAVLTKAPAIFLLPFLGLVILTDRATWQSGKFMAQRLKDAVLWVLIVGLLFVIVWPAILWVPNPEGNVLVLKRDFAAAAITPHHMVEDYTLNPWHYPATLLTRTTPITLVFGSFTVLWLITKFSIFNFQFSNSDTKKTYNLSASTADPPTWRATYLLLLCYIFFFVLMMTIGAKKGDRYILPVWPAIDVLAAGGIVLVSAWLSRLGVVLQRKKRLASAILHYQLPITNYQLLSAAALFYLATVVTQYHPYAIAYSNPLFPDNLSQELGWGEGLEQVAAWLNTTTPNAAVASWYPEELGAYTTARVAHINAHEQGQIRYVVMYRNMFGRAPDHYANNFIDEYYKKREPVFVAHVAGKEFAWVYEKHVYERIVGELLPGKHVGQEVIPTHSQLTGFDLLPATYSGKATAGTMYVLLREEIDGPVLQQWEIAVRDIEDNRWRTLKLDEAIDHLGQPLFLEIFVEGTSIGNAPTLRFTSDFDYRPGEMYVSDGAITPTARKKGDLGLRLRYRFGDQTAHEEESRLLPTP